METSSPNVPVTRAVTLNPRLLIRLAMPTIPSTMARGPSTKETKPMNGNRDNAPAAMPVTIAKVVIPCVRCGWLPPLP
ncbi:hypothetical protein D9M73_252440 [compost metagenome]